MTYFSPGPWRAVGPTIWPEGPSFDAIATVQVSNVDCWEQNARLIAAAPDLLELAECVVSGNPDYGYMHGLAVAAIAKVKGAAP